jgi:HEPN/Toprim N-terminal domain 1
MGTYCELYVANYPVFSSKSQVEPLVMTMFRETDKRAFDRKCIERNQIGWGHADWDPEEVERVVEYSATVAHLKDRLRIMGFTLSHAEADFVSCRDARVAELREMAADTEMNGDWWGEEIQLLETSSFRDFLDAFSEILRSAVHWVHFVERTPTAAPLARYVLTEAESFYWGFPCSDIRTFFRALVEIVPEDAVVTQDITDLVSGEYYSATDPVCDMGLDQVKGTYPTNSKVIVLTEGTTDTEVLKASIDLLYPHLSGYYSFMDLAVRAPGGASSLVQVVKAFSGAGIENRTIAIFDNDAAGHAAASLLREIPLPDNVRVMHYPDIPLASCYPTSGPSGTGIQDINGKACSIELYFGRDVLTSDGSMVPVQWKALDERVKRYQGEIQGKDKLKTRFFEKSTR